MRIGWHRSLQIFLGFWSDRRKMEDTTSLELNPAMKKRPLTRARLELPLELPPSLTLLLPFSLSTILDAPYINQNSISNILGYLESLAIFGVCFYYIDTKCTWASVCVCVCWHVSKLPFVIARKYFEALRAQFPNWNWGKITKISAILIQLVPLCDCSTCEWVWVWCVFGGCVYCG